MKNEASDLLRSADSKSGEKEPGEFAKMSPNGSVASSISLKCPKTFSNTLVALVCSRDARLTNILRRALKIGYSVNAG
jgi:hypothetical protein